MFMKSGDISQKSSHTLKRRGAMNYIGQLQCHAKKGAMPQKAAF
jgi:hypothetical protein